MDLANIIEWTIKGFLLTFILLGGFAYTTYYERKWVARIQVRIGPNRAGPFGLLQPIADAIKLFFKEELVPARVFKFVFLLAPILTAVPAVVVLRRGRRSPRSGRSTGGQRRGNPGLSTGLTRSACRSARDHRPGR